MTSLIAVSDIPGMAYAGEKFEVYGVEPHIFAGFQVSYIYSREVEMGVCV